MRVGLTGGIGSGKSTVSALLAERGAVIVDSDRLAREVVEPGTDGLAAIVERFGTSVLDADGRLDRPALGAVVFADERARRDLEAIVHPRVRTRGAQIEAEAGRDAVVVHDVPLLVETGQQDAFDAVVVVDVPVETQIERLVGQRGMPEEDARARIAAQASRQTRTGAADHVVDNTGSLEELTRSVDSLWESLTS